MANCNTCENQEKCLKLSPCIVEAYEQGRVDREKELAKLPNEYSEKLWENAYNRGRAKTIDEIKEKIKSRLIDNLSLENATKYGNENAKQQANSYATIMKYEVADCVEDLLDDLEELKGGAE